MCWRRGLPGNYPTGAHCGYCIYNHICAEEYEKQRLADKKKFDEWARLTGNYYEGLRAESFENCEKYFLDEKGHWQSGDWRRVKKNSALRSVPVRKFCECGAAYHPKYFKCSSCSELSTCKLGQYRMAEKVRAEKKFQKKFAPIKEYFEAVADLVEDFFKRHDRA